MPVFVLTSALIGFNAWAVSESRTGEERGILGGPENTLSEANYANASVMVDSTGSPLDAGSIKAQTQIDDSIVGFLFLDDAALANTGSLFGDTLVKRDELVVYKVQRGDTLSRIAANFGISLNTIFWANPQLQGRTVQPDTEITILPVSGVLYSVAPGDTVESIASAFSVNPEKIRLVNKLNPGEELELGLRLIVPDAKPRRTLASLAASLSAALPDAGDYFLFPLPKNSWNWGILHPNNAVDIANACGTSVYAAADGLVSETGSPDSWNGGYGGFMKVEHPNGTETLYAHLQEILAEQGTFVSRGDLIALVGRTGNVHGPTGCHLHFETHKVRNPFAK